MPSPAESTGALVIVGIGPGSLEQMTARALKEIAGSDIVIGNDTYLDQLEPLLTGKMLSGVQWEKKSNGQRLR